MNLRPTGWDLGLPTAVAAMGSKRTFMASRLRPAYVPAQVHERLVPGSGSPPVEPRVGHDAHIDERYAVGVPSGGDASNDPPNVRVDRGDRDAEGNRCHRCRGVGANTGELLKFVWIARDAALILLDDRSCRLEQGNRTAVIAEAAPGSDHRPESGRGQGLNRWKPPQELGVARGDPRSLRLLEHHLAHQDGVRIGEWIHAPGVGASAPPVPREKRAARRRRWG